MTGHCSHDTMSLKIASLTSITISPLSIPQMEGTTGATSFFSGNQIAFQHTPLLLIFSFCVKLLETAFKFTL